jgi:hypothetical protein
MVIGHILLKTFLNTVNKAVFVCFNSYYILYIFYNLLIWRRFKNLSLSLRSIFKKKVFYDVTKLQRPTSFFFLTSFLTVCLF